MLNYAHIQNNKLLGMAQAKYLNDDILNIEVDDELYNAYLQNPAMYIWDIENQKVIIDPEYDNKQKQKEKERIQELFMTRSDFFDGTIMAWGVGQDELLVLIQGLLATLPIEDVKKLIAINNFKNALNFYRKHNLFQMLTGIPIPLTETLQVIIKDEHWDKFFDETDKKNPEAYKELPTPELIPIPEPIEPEEPVEPEVPVEPIEPEEPIEEETVVEQPVQENEDDTI